MTARSPEIHIAQQIAAASCVTVLTGAGISTDSGVPDFRGPNGLWTTDPAAQRLFTLRDYLADQEVRRTAWRIRAEHAAWSARPNAGHEALVELEIAGKLHAIVTQNIDGLHQLAGNSEERVIEVHGSLYSVECLSCGVRSAMSDTLERVAVGEEDPACLRCGGILKAGTTSFGQPLDPDVFARANTAVRECELLLTVGTSLTVHPVAGLVDVASAHGAAIVILNAEPTPYDGLADVVLRGEISDVLPRIVAAVVGGEARLHNAPTAGNSASAGDSAGAEAA